MSLEQTRESRGTENRARVKSLKEEGKSVSEIIAITGLKKPTVYAYLRPDVPKAAKVAKAKGAAKTVAPKTNGSASVNVTPTKNGRFMVEVPADRLARVAAALA